MFLQSSVAMCHQFLQTVLHIVDHIPTPALGAILIALGVCVYESLGNSRLTPGRWR